jgi:alpha-galactosidase
MPASSLSEITAIYLAGRLELDAGHRALEWDRSALIRFYSDWSGKNPDPGLETEVRLLWSDQDLYIRFDGRYRSLFTFTDSDPNGRRDQLWDRDVVEAFLQPDPTRGGYYKEFEVSPNGMWVDLDIFPGGRSDLKSKMRHSAFVDEKTKLWSAEVAIPLAALTRNFDPDVVWRANFYRVEGKLEPRAYLAWQPTLTPQPNFHVPAKFGFLKFGGRNSSG